MQKRRNLRNFLARLLVVTILLGNMGTGYLAEFWMTSALAASGAQVQTPSNADEPDSEMPSDDVTSDQQNGLSENSYLRENPGATPSSASPSGIEKETVEITAVDVVVSLGTGGFDLLDGVTARAEDGDSVPVTVRDDGGFDINTEGIYTVEYEAESVTTTRNVTVFAFDPQPATLAEVQTMADAYETAYQAAMDEGGFLSALEVQKPRWQYEVDSSLMASGWRCDYLVDETYGVTYWSFFPAPMVLVADASVGTAAELATAINSASGTGYVIEITSDIDISYLSAACTIESWQDIIIRSDTGGLWTLTQSQTDIRHFIVNANGKLTLENIVLDGSTNGGGVVVNLNGSFIMNDNSRIQSCSASQGGGVYVIGTFTMNDNAVISNNNATASGGAVYIGSSGLTGGTFNMKSGEISGNTAAFYGGGVFCYGMKQNYPVTFNMEGGKICGNKASQGGGVGLESGASSPAILTITDSVVSENEAVSGSGIYAYCNSTFNAAQTLTLTRAVIANNVSTNTNGGGGGIHLSSYDNQDNTCAKQTLTVTDSKISNNEGGIGGGLCIGSASAPAIPVATHLM
ncbi:MAG: hypothetical protein LBN31_17225 [Hungatella sp.]|jgi:hypothetical protein|nr:hypothetical protein [Hungatella sp.]